MHWFNEPPQWIDEDGAITVTTGPKTDFWRKTEDGGIRDSGHFYHAVITGDFVASVKFSGEYDALYDQAGLMVRLDPKTWMKCGVEYLHGVQQASAVVTRDYSDWSVVPLPQRPPSVWLRVTRRGSTIEVQYSLDGDTYHLLRQAYLTPAGSLGVGLMCASPTGDGFTVAFADFSVEHL